MIYESLMIPVITHKDAMRPLYSTVTGHVISDPSVLNASYWRENLESPVLFNGAVQTFLRKARRSTIFVEIGPHSTLSSPLRQILRLHDADQASKYIPTLIRGQPQWKALLTTAGRLHTSGAFIDLSQVNGTGKVLTDLPSYPWLHEEVFLSETRLVREWKNPKDPHHELLGPRSLESTDIEPAWRRVLFVGQVPWLWDHMLGKDLIFPCAGYIAMAGEAIRQITGSEDYTIRNLLMKNPLLLNESEATELVTSLRPKRVTDTVDSSWYDFTITAYQNGYWKKHCVGIVGAGAQKHYAPQATTSYQRLVSSKTWYEVTKKRGLNFGPQFRRLENISASPSSFQAAACVRYDKEHDTTQCTRYSLHPTIIDQSLQMLGVAMTRGISRHLTKLCMPVAIEDIYIGPSGGLLSIDASCNATGDSMIGNAVMVADDKVVLSMENGMLFAVEDVDSVGRNSPMVAQVDWKPHIDLVSLADQVLSCSLNDRCTQLLGEITSSIIRETADKVRALAPSDFHLRKYQAWLCSHADKEPRSKNRGGDIISLCRGDHLGEAVQELENEIPQISPLLTIARKVSALSTDLVEGKIGCQDVGSQDDSLTTMCQSLSASTGCGEFFSYLGHSNPTMQVLVIGIGNGFSIMQALRGLTSSHGTPMYAKCTITDRSPDRVSQSKERFAWARDIEYIPLDISRDPMEQGLEAESYDLIVASDAFDADVSFSSSLKYIYTLLAPGGRLFYQPISPSFHILDYVMGLYPEWQTPQDCEYDKLSITPSQWKSGLQEADFVPNDMLTTKSQSPYNLDTTIALRPRIPGAHGGKIALLYLSKITDWARSVDRHFTKKGYTVTWFALGQRPPPGDVISLIDLDSPFFDDISADRFGQFQQLITQIMSSRILWVTESSQMACNDPRFGLILGVARTLRHEVMPDFATFEVDKFDDKAATSVVCVLEHLHTQKDRPLLDPDYEFALHEGTIHVSRAHWNLAREQLSASSLASHGDKMLDIGSYGLLNSLAWSEMPLCPLKKDEIEVDMKYIGLNFRVSDCF
jgi:hypothetical protein